MIDIHQIKEIVKPILLRNGVLKAGLFGSAARKEDVINDIDLLIQNSDNISLLKFIGIKQELEDALGMHVDLVDYDSIKSSLRETILKEEIRIL
jgi:predicted nucleotidyltransferase